MTILSDVCRCSYMLCNNVWVMEMCWIDESRKVQVLGVVLFKWPAGRSSSSIYLCLPKAVKALPWPLQSENALFRCLMVFNICLILVQVRTGASINNVWKSVCLFLNACFCVICFLMSTVLIRRMLLKESVLNHLIIIIIIVWKVT